MSDPRERIETEHIKCSFSVAGLWLIESDREDIYPCVPWPELVELAQKILAADEEWLDSQTPPLEELRAKYPGFSFALERVACGPTFCDVAWIVNAYPSDWRRDRLTEWAPTEAEAIERLAKRLAARLIRREDGAGERQFPVLGSQYRPGSPRSVPWSMLTPHEPQVLKNHCGQSLEVLARRGGLSPAEIYAVVNGLSWSVSNAPYDESAALRWLAAKLEELSDE